MEYHFSTREKNGSICLILSYKVGRRWKQKTKQGFRTKGDARLAQDTLLEAARKEAAVDADPDLADITLKDFVDNILTRDKKTSTEYGTRQGYKAAYLRMPQSIQDKPIRDITAADMVNAYNAMEDILKVSTMNETLAKLTAVFNYAIRVYHLRVDNPCLGVEKKKDKRKRRIKAFTKKESEDLLASLQDPLYHIVVLTALNTGMRCGEIAGLTWDSVDFFNRTITVNKQWGVGEDGIAGFKTPKSKNSYRTLHLTYRLAAALQKWKESQPISIDGRIFPTLSTRHQQLRNTIRKFKPGMNIHSLRHTFATLLLSETQDINLVAAVLGDTPATVARTYIHYTQDIRKKADDYIDRMFS